MAEPKLYNDTWTWDGRTWTEQKPARSQAAIVYVAMTGRVTLFGGSTGCQLADTWTWDGRTWARQHPTTVPPARAAAGGRFRRLLRTMLPPYESTSSTF